MTVLRLQLPRGSTKCYGGLDKRLRWWKTGCVSA